MSDNGLAVKSFRIRHRAMTIGLGVVGLLCFPEPRVSAQTQTQTQTAQPSSWIQFDPAAVNQWILALRTGIAGDRAQNPSAAAIARCPALFGRDTNGNPRLDFQRRNAAADRSCFEVFSRSVATRPESGAQTALRNLYANVPPSVYRFLEVRCNAEAFQRDPHCISNALLSADQIQQAYLSGRWMLSLSDCNGARAAAGLPPLPPPSQADPATMLEARNGCGLLQPPFPTNWTSSAAHPTLRTPPSAAHPQGEPLTPLLAAQIYETDLEFIYFLRTQCLIAADLANQATAPVALDVRRNRLVDLARNAPMPEVLAELRNRRRTDLADNAPLTEEQTAGLRGQLAEIAVQEFRAGLTNALQRARAQGQCSADLLASPGAMDPGCAVTGLSTTEFPCRPERAVGVMVQAPPGVGFNPSDGSGWYTRAVHLPGEGDLNGMTAASVTPEFFQGICRDILPPGTAVPSVAPGGATDGANCPRPASIPELQRLGDRAAASADLLAPEAVRQAARRYVGSMRTALRNLLCSGSVAENDFSLIQLASDDLRACGFPGLDLAQATGAEDIRRICAGGGQAGTRARYAAEDRRAEQLYRAALQMDLLMSARENLERDYDDRLHPVNPRSTSREGSLGCGRGFESPVEGHIQISGLSSIVFAGEENRSPVLTCAARRMMGIRESASDVSILVDIADLEVFRAEYLRMRGPTETDPRALRAPTDCLSGAIIQAEREHRTASLPRNDAIGLCRTLRRQMAQIDVQIAAFQHQFPELAEAPGSDQGLLDNNRPPAAYYAKNNAFIAFRSHYATAQMRGRNSQAVGRLLRLAINDVAGACFHPACSNEHGNTFLETTVIGSTSNGITCGGADPSARREVRRRPLLNRPVSFTGSSEDLRQVGLLIGTSHPSWSVGRSLSADLAQPEAARQYLPGISEARARAGTTYGVLGNLPPQAFRDLIADAMGGRSDPALSFAACRSYRAMGGHQAAANAAEFALYILAPELLARFAGELALTRAAEIAAQSERALEAGGILLRGAESLSLAARAAPRLGRVVDVVNAYFHWDIRLGFAEQTVALARATAQNTVGVGGNPLDTQAELAVVRGELTEAQALAAANNVSEHVQAIGVNILQLAGMGFLQSGFLHDFRSARGANMAELFARGLREVSDSQVQRFMFERNVAELVRQAERLTGDARTEALASVGRRAREATDAEWARMDGPARQRYVDQHRQEILQENVNRELAALERELRRMEERGQSDAHLGARQIEERSRMIQQLRDGIAAVRRAGQDPNRQADLLGGLIGQFVQANHIRGMADEAIRRQTLTAQYVANETQRQNAADALQEVARNLEVQSRTEGPGQRETRNLLADLNEALGEYQRVQDPQAQATILAHADALLNQSGLGRRALRDVEVAQIERQLQADPAQAEFEHRILQETTTLLNRDARTRNSPVALEARRRIGEISRTTDPARRTRRLAELAQLLRHDARAQAAAAVARRNVGSQDLGRFYSENRNRVRGRIAEMDSVQGELRSTDPQLANRIRQKIAVARQRLDRGDLRGAGRLLAEVDQILVNNSRVRQIAQARAIDVRDPTTFSGVHQPRGVSAFSQESTGRILVGIEDARILANRLVGTQGRGERNNQLRELGRQLQRKIQEIESLPPADLAGQARILAEIGRFVASSRSVREFARNNRLEVPSSEPITVAANDNAFLIGDPARPVNLLHGPNVDAFLNLARRNPDGSARTQNMTAAEVEAAFSEQISALHEGERLAERDPRSARALETARRRVHEQMVEIERLVAQHFPNRPADQALFYRELMSEVERVCRGRAAGG